MKRTAIAVSVALLCFGLAGNGLAQGRHDEKTHGMTKQSPAAEASVMHAAFPLCRKQR